MKRFSTSMPCALALVAMLTGCQLGQTTSQPVADVPKPSTETAERFDEARDKLKNPSAVFLAYARMQEHQGLIAEARQSYGLVLKEKPDNRDAMLGLARLDQLAGRSTEAEQRFQQIAAAHPNDPLVLESLGQFYASEGRWPQAIAPLRQAVALNPEESNTRYNLGVAVAHTGDVEQARAHFEKTVGPAAAHYNLGYILLEEQRFDLAERELIAAIAANPELEEAQALLGELRGKQEPDTRLVSNESQPNERPAHRHADFRNDAGDFGQPPSRVAHHERSIPTESGRPSAPITRPTNPAPTTRPAPRDEFEPLPSWSPGRNDRQLSRSELEQRRNQQDF